MPRRGKTTGFAVFFTVVICAGSLLALGGPETPDQKGKPDAPEATSQRPIRVEVPLVLVQVSVIDPYNRFVTGLEREHFQIFEDKKPQKIEHFSNEDVPLSAGLLFDASGSMSDKIDKARMAVMQFFRSSNPNDEFFLISFNDRPNQVADFTQDEVELQNKLNFTEAKGRTSLLDAIYLGLHEMRKAKHSRKVLLIFSDGGDNHSRYNEGEIKKAVKESDVQIYAVGIYEPYSSRSRTPEELAGPSLLTEIAETTGGRYVRSSTGSEMAAAINTIVRGERKLVGWKTTTDYRDLYGAGLTVALVAGAVLWLIL